MSPREDYIAASQQLSAAQRRLDADRRHLNTQLRTANRSFPLGSQVAERDDFLQPALVAERLSLERVGEAQRLRAQKYDQLPDPTEAEGAH